MKTLADLKRDCDKYEWRLIKNSWYTGITESQACWRKVATVKTSKFSLLTHRDGETVESWIDWPKAREVEIYPCENSAQEIIAYEVIFRRETGAVNPHEMIYMLRPIQD